MTVNTFKFLNNVKRLITQPQNQALMTDLDMLALASRKMQDTMVPLIDSVNGEYFVTRSETPVVQNQQEYRIPTRALARKLRDLKLVDPSGGRVDFPMIAIEREQYYRASSIPFGFYFYGDRINLVPIPSGSGYSIQFWYFLAPGELVQVTAAGLVTGISGDDVTVSMVPSSFQPGVLMDFIQGISGSPYLKTDQAITNVAGNTITFASGAVPLDLAIGDWISLSGESPVLQIPDQAVPYLETLTAMEILYSISDFEGMDRLKETRDDQKKNLLMLLEPRIEGEAEVIINDRGFLRNNRRNLANGWIY